MLKSSHRMMDSTFLHECKAAFLASYEDIHDEIHSRDEFIQVLQQSGRNPSKKAVARFWKPGTSSVTFQEFCRICREMPCTTGDDLMKAFRQIDINGDNYITNSELKKVLTTRGEKMTTAEVQAIIDEVDENGDGKLDYKEFTKMLLDTQTEYMKMACRKMDEKSQRRKVPEVIPRLSKSEVDSTVRGKDLPPTIPRHHAAGHKKESDSAEEVEDDDDDDDDSDIVIGSQVSFRQSPSRSAAPKPHPRPLSAREEKSIPLAHRDLKLARPKNIKDWKCVRSKGCFFLEEDGTIASHRYSLELTRNSAVWITMEPYSFKHGENAIGRDSRRTPKDTALLLLRPDNSVITLTEQRDSQGRYAVRCDLTKGKYQLIPFNTSCRLKPATNAASSDIKLVRCKDDKYILTKAFKDSLMEIFDLCDLDGNDLLSRDEFTWFNQRTSGEDVLDEEWTVVEDNVEMRNGELTKKGFIELNQMEADDNQGEVDDLWATLSFMGYNRNLEMDEACPFLLEVHVEEGSGSLKVTNLETAGQLVDTAIINIVKDKGEMRKVSTKKDVLLHTYSNDFWSCIVLENKSHSRLSVCVDCTRSKNCATNQRSLRHIVDVPPKSSVIGHHLMPETETQEWNVNCHETIVK